MREYCGHTALLPMAALPHRWWGWKPIIAFSAAWGFLTPFTVTQSRRKILYSWSRLDADEAPDSLIKAPEVSEELQVKIEEYLGERAERIDRERTLRETLLANREAAKSNVLWRAANYLFSLESLLPTVPEEDEQSADPLAYTELERFGYSWLIEEVMNAGGHVAVSRALGLEVRVRSEQDAPRRLSNTQPEPVRGLVLGSAREALLDSGVASLNATMVKEQAKSRRRREQSVREPPRKSSLRLTSSVPVTDSDVSSPVITEWPLLLAPFSLGVAGRLYGSIALATIVAGSGSTATLQAQAALAPILDSAAVFEACRDISVAFLAGNIVSVALTLLRQPERPWFAVARAAFAGPCVFLEDRKS